MDIFEDLDFRGYVAPEYQRDLRFTMTQSGRMDGFLVWLTLHTIEGEMIDIFADEHCWIPVHLPVFYPGATVAVGDRIEGGLYCDAL